MNWLAIKAKTLIKSNKKYKNQNKMDIQNKNEIKLLSPGSLMKYARNIFRERFWVLAKIQLVSFLFSLIASFVQVFAGLYLLKSVFSLINLGNSSTGYLTVIFTIVLIVLSVVFAALTTNWILAALICAIRDRDEKIGAIESYRRGWKKIFPLWWTNLLYGLQLSALILLSLIPLILLIWLRLSQYYWIWMILAIISVFIWAINFALANFVIVEEHENGYNALLKSKYYISNKWWAVVWRFSYTAIIVIAVLALYKLVEYLLDKYIFSNIETTSYFIYSYGKLAIDILFNILILLFSPLLIIYNYLIYKNLKEIKKDNVVRFPLGIKIKYILLTLLPILLIIGSIVLSMWYYSNILKNKSSLFGGTISPFGTSYDINQENSSPLDNENNSIDTSLDITASYLKSALNRYYEKNGFCPPDNKIEYLWSGNKTELNQEPKVAEECGTINHPSSRCGISFITGANKSTCLLNVKYLNKKEENNEIGRKIINGQIDLQATGCKNVLIKSTYNDDPGLGIVDEKGNFSIKVDASKSQFISAYDTKEDKICATTVYLPSSDTINFEK